MDESRYAKTFSRLRRQGEGAFVPFTVLGDPDPETSLDVLRAFARGGADMLELGIAFSDPIADGSVIQGADKRALDAGVTPADALALLKRFREEFQDIPLGLLLYANLIHRPAPLPFYRQMAAAGVDSVLVADLPLEERADFKCAADEAGVESVSMVTPTTDSARLERILDCGGPYIYTVSRLGVTGQDRRLAGSAAPLIRRIKSRSDIPVLLGFGISKPEHVCDAMAAGADGAISGSAMVQIVAEEAGEGGRPLGKTARRRLHDRLVARVATMKKASRR